MEPSQVRRAVAAARSVAGEIGLPVDDAVVIHNSDRIVVRLLPGDVLARVAPQAWEAGLRQITLAAPHIAERVAAWAAEVDDPEQTPALPGPDRALLSSTFTRGRNAMHRWETGEQLLHGEPHPGNLLSTRGGPRFVDLHTCQRGPVEYDLAYAPEAVEAHYPGANHDLVHQFRILMWAGFTTMRWRPGDQLPNRDHWRVEGLNRLRAALDRG
jgi:hypothetical protein